MFLPLSSILVTSRQRTSITPANLQELKLDIAANGLLHAPVVWKGEGENYHLVVGERRLTAMKALHGEGFGFQYAGERVPLDHIPVTFYRADASELDRQKAELGENIYREDLSWQDKNRALAAIYAIHVAANPAVTVSEVARQIEQSGGVSAGPKLVEGIRKAIPRAVTIAENLDNPVVAKARNADEAYSLIVKHTEEAASAKLRKRLLAVEATRAEASISLRHADSLELLPRLDPEQFDLILTDPPYGIAANSAGFRNRTVIHHGYEDTPEVAYAAMRAIIVEGFRVAKLRANLLVFGDIDLFPYFKEQCKAVGWVPFRTPLTWRKSVSEGLAPWGSQGPRRTVEWLFYATKGQRGLLTSPTDVLQHNRVPRGDRIHAAQKPQALLREIIEFSTLPGDSILDPFMGSGSTLRAARDLHRRGVGIEKDEIAYNTAMTFVFDESQSKEEPNDASSDTGDNFLLHGSSSLNEL